MKLVGKAAAAAALASAALFVTATPAGAQSTVVAHFDTEVQCKAAKPAYQLLFPTDDLYCVEGGMGWILFRS